VMERGSAAACSPRAQPHRYAVPGIMARGSPASAGPEEGDDVQLPDYHSLDGVEVTNQDGEKLGRIDGLFVDDRVEVPTWVAVHSGLFGSHHALLPLAQARFVEGRLLVPYSRDDLALAPHHDPDQPLSVEQEQVLFAHYNVGYSDADTAGPHTGVEADQTGLAGSPGAGSHPVELGEVQVLAPDVPGVPGLPTATVPPRLRRYRPPDAG
jgi:PRC-barrel domain